jgi:hypothetical protein
MQLLIDKTVITEEKRDSKKDQKMLTGIEAQMFVVKKGKRYWQRILEWQNGAKLLSPNQVSLLQAAAMRPERVQDWQATKLVEINNTAIEQGFFPNE